MEIIEKPSDKEGVPRQKKREGKRGVREKSEKFILTTISLQKKIQMPMRKVNAKKRQEKSSIMTLYIIPREMPSRNLLKEHLNKSMFKITTKIK